MNRLDMKTRPSGYDDARIKIAGLSNAELRTMWAHYFLLEMGTRQRRLLRTKAGRAEIVESLTKRFVDAATISTVPNGADQFHVGDKSHPLLRRHGSR
jgi:hypothetical protein